MVGSVKHGFMRDPWTEHTILQSLLDSPYSVRVAKACDIYVNGKDNGSNCLANFGGRVFIPSHETGCECFDYEGDCKGSDFYISLCFGDDELITVKREGGEVLDIPIKEAKYSDKIMAFNDNMELIWDDPLFLYHFENC